MIPYAIRDEAEHAGLIRALAARAGWGRAAVTPMNVDSSVRRFLRVRQDGRSAVVMDARAPLNDTRAFLFIRDKFARLGFSVPEVYACDHDHSLVMMEDFGDERFFEIVCHRPERIAEIYTAATDALVHKAKADPIVAGDGSAAYGDEYWGRRTELFLTFYAPHFIGAIPAAEQDAYRRVFAAALTAARMLEPVLLHGDYGAQNLYYKPERPGVRNVAWIDFQDMTPAPGNMTGSPAFDLVFLLQDPRVALPDGLEDAMTARFIAGAGISDQAVFAQEYAVIGAAQAAKCLGLFARLGCAEGRAEYLPFLAKCRDSLDRNLRHPALREVKAWFDRCLPADRRA